MYKQPKSHLIMFCHTNKYFSFNLLSGNSSEMFFSNLLPLGIMASQVSGFIDSWAHCLVRETMVNPKEDSVIIMTVTAGFLMLHHAFLRASQQLDEASSMIPVYRGGSQVSKSLSKLSKVILLEGGVKLLA